MNKWSNRIKKHFIFGLVFCKPPSAAARKSSPKPLCGIKVKHNLMEKKLKKIRVFLIIYGSIGVFCALLMLLVLGIIISTAEDATIYNTGFLNMLILVIIGVAVLFFGIFVKRIKSNKSLIFLAISLISLIWYITYSIKALQEGLYPFGQSTDYQDGVLKWSCYARVIVNSTVFFVPELIIWIQLRKIDKKNKK